MRIHVGVFRPDLHNRLDQLQAVRSGKWKLHQPLKSKKRNWGRPEGKTPLKLFDLGADIREDKDVSADHADVVKRMPALAVKAREDLGDVGRKGKGQRPAGWVEKATPRLLPAAAQEKSVPTSCSGRLRLRKRSAGATRSTG